MAFPTTSLIDAFTRADESPVAGGWAGPTRTSGQLKIVSNALVVVNAADATKHSYWNTSFGADQEAWITVSTLPASGGGVSVTARIAAPGTAGVDFYQWTYTVDTGWRMFWVNDNGYVQIGTTAPTPTLAAGDSIGFELIGSALRGMHKTGGTWSQIRLVTDATIVAGGFIGVEITDGFAVADSFGGGATVSAASIGRPSVDSVDGAWTDQAGATILFSAIDEVTASDTDYIRSELSPSSSATRVKIATITDPVSSTGHIIRWRVARDAAGGNQINMTVTLRQGGGDSLGAGTSIAAFTRSNVLDTWTTYEETLSAAQADAITNYADLYLEFASNQV